MITEFSHCDRELSLFVECNKDFCRINVNYEFVTLVFPLCVFSCRQCFAHVEMSQAVAGTSVTFLGRISEHGKHISILT